MSAEMSGAVMKINTTVWVLAGVSLFSAAARAQSLADVARKEAERRKAITTPARVYTDSDVRRFPTPTPPEPPPPDPAKPAETAGAAAAPAKPVEPSVDLGEQYWRKLMGDARAALGRSRSYLEALEDRVKTATSDFYAREDPAGRSLLAAQRSRALDDVKRLKQDMAEQEKAVAKIEADARKANVPPGWVR